VPFPARLGADQARRSCNQCDAHLLFSARKRNPIHSSGRTANQYRITPEASGAKSGEARERGGSSWRCLAGPETGLSW
jgi:hypothetical protein